MQVLWDGGSLMTEHIAFLRGMNLGGRRLSNLVLKAAFADFGFHGVGTYRASGNVILTTEDAPDLVERIEAGLEKQLGYAVPTLLRSVDELRRIVAFEGLERRGVDGGKLQVTLLRDPPSDAVRQQVLAHASADDGLAFGAAELFWLPRGGMLDSALDLKALDKLLGLGTMRTMGTLEGILKKCT
ncbi:MAG: DUF1697 domain-containing protein [Myxococcota bacterium]